MRYKLSSHKWLLSLVFTLSIASTAAAQNHEDHNGHNTADTCYHIEFSLAHHYLELAYLMEANQIEPSSILAGNLTSEQLFNEFYRLITLIQARYPEHHLEQEFYEKAIDVANSQKNLGASAYLMHKKQEMLKALYGEDFLTRECHCGKCVKHED